MSGKSGPDSAVFVWLVFLVLFADKSGRSCLCGCFVHYSGPSGLLGGHLACGGKSQVLLVQESCRPQVTRSSLLTWATPNILPHNWWSPIRGHHALHRTDTPLQHSMQTADSGAVSPALDGDCAYVPSGQSAAASALCDTITRVAT